MKEQWKPIAKSISTEIMDFGGGLNITDSPYTLAENESCKCNNIDMDAFPALAPRQGREKTDIGLIPVYDGQICEIGELVNGDIYLLCDNNIWNLTTQTLLFAVPSNTKRPMPHFRILDGGQVCDAWGTFVQTSHSIMYIDRYGELQSEDTFFGISFVAILGDDYYYAAKDGDTIYVYSPIKNMTLSQDNLNTYDIMHTWKQGAGELRGVTGLVTYMDKCYFFTKTGVYNIIGKRGNRKIQEVSQIGGCIEKATIAQCSNKVIFLGSNGVNMISTSNKVECISDKVKDLVTNIDFFSPPCAAYYNGKYYLNIYPTNGATYLMVYDIERGIWSKEDIPPMVAISVINNVLYAYSKGGELYKLYSPNSDEDITWEWESSVFKPFSISEKTMLERVNISVELQEDDARVMSEVILENGDVIPLSTIKYSDNEERIRKLEVPIGFGMGTPSFRLHIKGVGRAKVYAIEKQFKKVR
ncbi:MAG: hypothetical protein LBM38_06550 [Clostridiales bacterium]|jgi:hypothetical protein|nr:hypothetical protein [Clostridiales bacterium]